jgi:uncharacterized protein YndB with AHSA1/START domain
MADENALTAAMDESTFVITRTFDAPRDLAWKAFTEPDRMKHWWGPKGFTVFAAKMDLRPRGHLSLRPARAGRRHDVGQICLSRNPTPGAHRPCNSFSDEAGNLTRHPTSPTWPLEMLSTFLFAEEQGRTTVTIKWVPLNADETERKTFDAARPGMQQGWTGTLDQLAEYLAMA